MSLSKFDLIVIGTGPAASTVAKKIAGEGRQVAVVESREFGGTCALRGCNPKKVYTNAATLIDQARGGQGKLVRFDDARLDWGDLLAFKKTFTEPVLEKSEASYKKAGIATFHGHAAFVEPQKIAVRSKAADSNTNLHLQAERIVIASGARPAPLQIPGEEHVLLSDGFLELAELPKRIVFIGGGYIAMEFAHVAARYGCDVVVLQSGPQILPTFDADLCEQLRQYSNGVGIDIKTNSEVTGIEKRGAELVVSFQTEDGATQTVTTELVVHGAGRVPNLEGMDLEAGRVAYGKQGVTVDEHLQSPTNSAVFAAGDCAASGMPQLTPTANEEARILVKNLFAEVPEKRPDYGVVPSVAFTVPPIAAVGALEADLKQAGHDFEVHHEDTSQWGSVRKTGHACAGYKILIDRHSQHILGAHLLGPAADETINLFALAMKHGLTATDIKSTLFVFPTFASDIRKMV